MRLSYDARTRFRFAFRLATHHQLPGSCFEKNDATLAFRVDSALSGSLFRGGILLRCIKL